MFKIREEEVLRTSKFETVESLQWRSIDPLLRCVKCFSDIAYYGSVKQLANVARLGGFFFFQFLAEVDFSEEHNVGLSGIRNSSNGQVPPYRPTTTIPQLLGVVEAVNLKGPSAKTFLF